MDNLTFYYNIVEKATAKIGLDPKKSRTRNAGKWTVTKAGIPVWIDIVYIQNENRVYFQVASPIIKMTSENKNSMALDLLTTNNLLYGVAFCINRENVFIKTIRETEGLDMNEAYSMILRVGNYSATYRKALNDKYPGRAPLDIQHVPSQNNQFV